MDNKNYLRSYDYVGYIKLARLCETDQFGAHYSFMLNLMDKEENGIHVKHLSHSKLLADVKRYMLSATKAALKRKLSKEDKSKLKTSLSVIETALTSIELLLVCDQGISILRNYKPV